MDYQFFINLSILFHFIFSWGLINHKINLYQWLSLTVKTPTLSNNWKSRTGFYSTFLFIEKRPTFHLYMHWRHPWCQHYIIMNTITILFKGPTTPQRFALMWPELKSTFVIYTCRISISKTLLSKQFKTIPTTALLIKLGPLKIITSCQEILHKYNIDMMSMIFIMSVINRSATLMSFFKYYIHDFTSLWVVVLIHIISMLPRVYFAYKFSVL